ncbi:costars family protein ABRACL isoform X1 [Hirundo rustica]|uniref:costars family protein ABRACL isoform X1 n=1 Tax=Hirundo rustica TaxID=43150 RepID=UPI001A946A28|nr:costars family protein ABRACL isoform X1 [Hirundo rustica]
MKWHSFCSVGCEDMEIQIHCNTTLSRTTMNVEHEISLLVEEIRRLGTKNADGQVSVKFGVLFADEKCANLFEALVGTLKAAKRRKIVTYQGELLLQGVHDNVDIMLLQD